MTEKKPICMDDVFTELSLNLDKVFLMALEIYDYFGKRDGASDRSIDCIRQEFGNISARLEIAIDYLCQSRDLIAEQQDGEQRSIVG